MKKQILKTLFTVCAVMLMLSASAGQPREILRLNGMDSIPVISAAENTELRPRFTLLDNMMLRITGLYQMPDWKTALADYFSTKKGGAHK